MNKSKAPGLSMKRWGHRSRVRVMWGSFFTECFSRGLKPHLPQPSQIFILLKTLTVLIFLSFFVIPSGYPITWLDYSSKEIVTYSIFVEQMVLHIRKLINQTQILSFFLQLSGMSLASIELIENFLADVQSWPEAMPAFFISGEKLANARCQS